jgi:hypothetical protein
MELQSKKWRTTLVTLMAIVGQQYTETPVPMHVVVSVAVVASVYLLSQGLADFGKERARIQAKLHEPKGD